MSELPEPIVILGIGNVLLRDDGVGVRVVRRLEHLARTGEVHLPAGTSIVDGGTLGIRLLASVSNAAALIVVDAAELHREPGAIEVHELAGGPWQRDVTARGPRDTADRTFAATHAGMGELLAIAQLTGTQPARVIVVGVQPGQIETGLELTGPVASALPAIVQAVLGVAQAVAATSRSSEPTVQDLVHEVAGAVA